MGYESKLYIVNKSSAFDNDGKRYAQVIAMFDMCKFDGFGSTFKKETDCYIYADDGNTEILEDRYGDNLKEASINEVIVYLEKFEKREKFYRRVAPLLGMLRGFDLSEWDNLFVLHFGH